MNKKEKAILNIVNKTEKAAKKAQQDNPGILGDITAMGIIVAGWIKAREIAAAREDKNED